MDLQFNLYFKLAVFVIITSTVMIQASFWLKRVS